MMSGLASRIGRIGNERGDAGADHVPGTGAFGFAAKMIGIGLCAGLALCCCQFVIETFFAAVR